MFIDKSTQNKSLTSRIETVKTKEELFELLNKYQGLLSNEIYEYIEGLINLDYSVIRDYITPEDKKRLGQLDLFRLVSIFNIYNRAIKIAEEVSPHAEISGNESHREGLDITDSYGENYISLFNFNYSHGPIGIPRERGDIFKLMKVGNITIYEAVDARELKNEKKLAILNMQLERLQTEKNPFEAKTFGKGLSNYKEWETRHRIEIAQVEKEIEDLKNLRKLTNTDKKEIKKTKKFADAILSDYGITRQDFKKYSNDYMEDAEYLECTKNTPNVKILRKITNL